MAGLLGSLHSAKTGMTVSQTSIQTTSHNINNMNTPGYSRQRVEQSAKSAYSNPGFNSSLGAGQLGTGVEATNVIRIRNTFYDFQFRSESHNYGQTSVKYEYYKNMESIFNEPSDTAISSSLNNFFNSWHELSKDPNNVGAKNVVIENSKYLANNISQVYKKLDNLQTNLDKQFNETIKDIKGMLDELETLDKTIKVVEGSGKTPNDLLDDRDRILDELSFKIDLNSEAGKNVLEKIKNGDPLTDDDKETLANTSGELAGLVKMDKELDNYKDKINVLAQGIADSVNEIYKNGDDTKPDLFIVATDLEIKNGKPILSINEDIEKDPLSLEMTADIATQMYNLKDKKIEFGEDPNKVEMTINNFYNNTIQTLGEASQAAIKDESNQSKLLTSIDASRSSISGVSLDEEMVSLIQFQHAYNASAKVVSTIDSLLDVVINGLKR